MEEEVNSPASLSSTHQKFVIPFRTRTANKPIRAQNLIGRVRLIHITAIGWNSTEGCSEFGSAWSFLTCEANQNPTANPSRTRSVCFRSNGPLKMALFCNFEPISTSMRVRKHYV